MQKELQTIEKTKTMWQDAEGEVTTIKSEKEGSVMLQYPLLTKSNYVAWSTKIHVNLQTQGVWDAIEHGDKVKERKVRMPFAAID